MKVEGAGPFPEICPRKLSSSPTSVESSDGSQQSKTLKFEHRAYLFVTLQETHLNTTGEVGMEKMRKIPYKISQSAL